MFELDGVVSFEVIGDNVDGVRSEGAGGGGRLRRFMPRS